MIIYTTQVFDMTNRLKMIKSVGLTLLFLVLVSPVWAQSTTDDLERLKKVVAAKPTNVVARHNLARIYFEQKKWDDVIATLKPFSDGLTTQGLYLLAQSQHEKAYYDDEIQTLKQLVGKSEVDYRAWALLGDAQYAGGKLDTAVPSLRKSLEINPKYRPAYDSLIQIFVKTKSEYEMREILNDMVKNLGESPYTTSQLCRSYFESGFFDQAKEYCEKATKIDKKNSDSVIYLARSYMELQDTQKGLKLLIDASKIYPKSEHVQWTLGNYYLGLNNPSTAFRYFQVAQKNNPKSFRTLKGVAITAFTLEKYDISLQSFQEACKLDKSVGPDLRTAVATLRQKQVLTWQSRFQEESARCR
jgi:tetratricopeptide (TPR) repeat protein